MTRRVVVCAFLFAALAVSGVGWAETAPARPTVDGAVTLAAPPGLTIDAALSARTDVLTSGGAEQRAPKSRTRSAVAVTVGVSLLFAGAGIALARLGAVPPRTLRRRWSAVMRAPPLLRLA